MGAVIAKVTLAPLFCAVYCTEEVSDGANPLVTEHNLSSAALRHGELVRTEQGSVGVKVFAKMVKDGCLFSLY